MRQVDCDDKDHRWRYWNFLRNVQGEFINLTHRTEYGDQKDFEHFLLANYGIKPMFVEGRYSASYYVVDDKKFLLTKLKHDF